MAVSADEFRHALAQLASGVTVVTTRDTTGRPLGLTVSSFCSVSLDPPLVLVCLDRRVEANAGLAACGRFAVSVLAEGQEEISQRFSSGGAEKFAPPGLAECPDGLPVIEGALAHISCRLRATHEGGDHLIHVGEVEWTSVRPGPPLAYQRRRYQRLQGEAEEPAGRMPV